MATLSGVLANEVVTGYNYDAERKEVQLFTGPRAGSGMPCNLLIHMLKVQRVSEDARVTVGGFAIIGLVPSSRTLSTVHWAFVSNVGTTVTLDPGPTDRYPTIKVAAILDLSDVRELSEYLAEDGAKLPTHIFEAISGVRAALLDALDLGSGEL